MIKRCPKCGGNVYLDEDQYGWFEHCLQCGYTCDLQGVLDLAKREALQRKETVSVRELDELELDTGELDTDELDLHEPSVYLD